jgi:hypothetical protein
MKAGYGKTVRPVCAADGGQPFIGRLLRPDSIEANRNVPLAHFSLAAALALQGLLDQAQTAAKADLDPNFSLRRFRNNAAGNNPTYLAGRNRFSQGLRIAGGPEG